MFYLLHFTTHFGFFILNSVFFPIAFYFDSLFFVFLGRRYFLLGAMRGGGLHSCTRSQAGCFGMKVMCVLHVHVCMSE